jgi:phage terminase large subunit
MNIDSTINYDFIDYHYVRGTRGCVLVGGTRSGKTISILQWIIIYCKKNRNKQIAICRDTLTNLKRTVLKDFKSLCYGYEGYTAMAPKMRLNQQDMTATINGNTVTFMGVLDDPMRVYGFKSDIFFINEAVSTYQSTFDQLEQRCNEFFICDCNPSHPKSWVYELKKRDDVFEYRTSYKNNPFLNPRIVRKIESYEPTEENIRQGTADERKWCIYGKGLIYKGREIIYPKWQTYKNEPEGYDYQFYGLDWGWNDPLVVVKLTISSNKLYIRQIVYSSELEFSDLLVILKQERSLIEGETYLVCDSAEPRSILALQNEGLPAMKTTKGSGSILDGIRKIQTYEIFIHEDATGIQSEADNYKFKIDEKTDTILDIPIDKHNHGWDAVRYPIITFL